jgi:hypothetical protein
MIANIAFDDALILPHRANPPGLNFRERQVADWLTSYPVVGPGTVHRVCLETQRRFFDPPDLGGPGVWAKYR